MAGALAAAPLLPNQELQEAEREQELEASGTQPRDASFLWIAFVGLPRAAMLARPAAALRDSAKARR